MIYKSIISLLLTKRFLKQIEVTFQRHGIDMLFNINNPLKIVFLEINTFQYNFCMFLKNR